MIAARDLEDVAGELRSRLDLAEPYSDPNVEHFGLRNAVFALRDTFLEVVSPMRPDAPAARLLERRGGDSGYMLMFQVGDLAAARDRARAAGLREVFEVSIEEMAEVHLHPADTRGAIVSLSEPQPPESWCWGGPGWSERAAPLRVAGAAVAVTDPGAVIERWQRVLGTGLANLGLRVMGDDRDRGLVEIILSAEHRERAPESFMLGGVQFVFES